MTPAWLEKLPEKLRRRIAPPDANGCMEWLAGKTQDGYGVAHHEGRSTTAHRIIYGLVVAPVAKGLDLDHGCRNPACVNVAHLEPVSRRENIRRGLHGVLRKGCPRGHDRDRFEYVDSRGSRVCRECARLSMRRSRARRASKAVAP